MILRANSKFTLKPLWSVYLLSLCTLGQLHSQQQESDNTFTTKDLHFEKLLFDVYNGNFLEIPFDRDDVNFSLLYGAYLDVFAKNCKNALPENKVEMMTQKCVTEEVTRNGYNVEISRTCVEWVSVGTGLYAHPDLYAAKLALEKLQAGDALRNAFRMISQNDPITASMDIVGNAQAAQSDMLALLQMNGCTSKGLQRFQDNLRLFALNKQPILSGSVSNSKTTDLKAEHQNIKVLAEDLIHDQSMKWVMNKYTKGSTSISKIDLTEEGIPLEISASYLYLGFNGKSNGKVRITFTEGLPECMYFFDFPTSCRTPNRTIVSHYAQGNYSK